MFFFFRFLFIHDLSTISGICFICSRLIVSTCWRDNLRRGTSNMQVKAGGGGIKQTYTATIRLLQVLSFDSLNSFVIKSFNKVIQSITFKALAICEEVAVFVLQESGDLKTNSDTQFDKWIKTMKDHCGHRWDTPPLEAQPPGHPPSASSQFQQLELCDNVLQQGIAAFASKLVEASSSKLTQVTCARTRSSTCLWILVTSPAQWQLAMPASLTSSRRTTTT